MGIIRKTQAVALILDEFNKGSNAISAIELIKRLNKKINKTISLIEKLQEKNQRLNSEKKTLEIKNDLSELESIKEKQEENYSLLKQKINIFTHEKIIHESTMFFGCM